MSLLPDMPFRSDELEIGQLKGRYLSSMQLNEEAINGLEDVLKQISVVEDMEYWRLEPLLRSAEILLLGKHRPVDLSLRLEEAWREIEALNDAMRNNPKTAWKAVQNAKRILVQDIRNMM